MICNYRSEKDRAGKSRKRLTALILSFSAANSKTSGQARTHFYLHASLPSRGCMVTYSITRPRFYTVCSLCPAITPRALPLLSADERLMGWGACRGEKGKKAPLPCSAMLSFLFLLCQTCDQPCLFLRFARSRPIDCFVKLSGLLTISRCLIHSLNIWELLGYSKEKGSMRAKWSKQTHENSISTCQIYISAVCAWKR